jgi:hypothetical protein
VEVKVAEKQLVDVKVSRKEAEKRVALLLREVDLEAELL